MSGSDRLVVKMTPLMKESLEECVAMDSSTRTEVIRKAISLLRFVREAERRGCTMLIEDPEKGVTRVAIF